MMKTDTDRLLEECARIEKNKRVEFFIKAWAMLGEMTGLLPFGFLVFPDIQKDGQNQ